MLVIYTYIIGAEKILGCSLQDYHKQFQEVELLVMRITITSGETHQLIQLSNTRLGQGIIDH